MVRQQSPEKGHSYSRKKRISMFSKRLFKLFIEWLFTVVITRENWKYIYAYNSFFVRHRFPKKKLFYQKKLTSFEQFLAKVPVWSLALFVVVLIVPASLKIDSEINLQKPYSLDDVLLKTLRVFFEKIDAIAIVTAVALYIKEAPDRREQKSDEHSETWQIIENARGIGMSLSRYKALQDLNDDDISLEEADLPSADLCAIQLAGANLGRANLERANLERANLERANLEQANLMRSSLVKANLQGANLKLARINLAALEGASLYRANLVGAQLEGADLQGAMLGDANLMLADLQGANLKGANLKGAHLLGADLEGANLEGANLAGVHLDGANLWGANLKGTNLERAHLEEVKSFSDQQLDQALLCSTKLPIQSKLNPDRDCPED
jgi:uncharacterized protein YjbI with pentapeptide repeats